jgi:GH24 family phage-related lysozyme (muramidase)
MLSNGFIDYLKKVENGGKIGWDTDKELWYPHPSPEGGNDTIGYGHKLLNVEVEVAEDGMTDKEIEDLLVEDMYEATRDLEHILNDYFDADYTQLSDSSQEMLADFAFNLGGHGLRKFPKFVNATIDEDIDTMRKEYKRYYTDGNGVKKELEQRNKEFYTLFLA